MKLLIVEDNIELSNDLGTFFAENGFVEESAYSLQAAQQNICDLNQLSIHYQYDNGQHTYTVSKPKVKSDLNNFSIFLLSYIGK